MQFQIAVGLPVALELHEVLLLAQPQDFILLCQVAGERNVIFQRQLSVLQALPQVVGVSVVPEN